MRRQLAAACQRSSGAASHDCSVATTCSGSGAQTPAPSFTTKSTLPSSCPGILLYRMIGRPLMQASLIVPGPALVTRTLDACINSGMVRTKPYTDTGTFHRWLSSRFFNSRLRPAMITIATFRLASFMACAVFSNGPMPSPPPTIRITGISRGQPIFLRISLAASCSWQNLSATGSPITWIFSGEIPNSIPFFRASSVGTMIRSARLSNQKACVETMSVTTVMNGMRRSRNVRKTGVFIRGCTLTIRSQGCSSIKR